MDVRIVNNGELNPAISFTIARASTATRVNSAGLIETVAANTARTDYDPLTKAVKGLLIEEASTNLIPYSENFDYTTGQWIDVRSSVNLNAAVAPDGTLTADAIVEDGSTNTHTRRKVVTLPGTDQIYSVFAKAINRNWLAIGVDGSAGVNRYSYFDLANGVVGTKHANHTDSGIESFGNGWYRCWVRTAAPSASDNTEVAPASGDSGVSYAGTNGSESIYVWGAQLEAGSSLSSYIPTTSASVTRAADDISLTDLSKIGWNSDASSWYCKAFSTYVGGNQRFFSVFTDGAGNTDRQEYFRGANDTQVFAWVEENNIVGVSSAFSQSTTETMPTGLKFAAALADNDFAISASGEAVTVDNTCEIDNGADLLWLGRYHTPTNYLQGHILDLAYSPRRLPNDQLVNLSTYGLGGARNFIAVGRRTFKGPPKKAIFPKAKRTLRG